MEWIQNYQLFLFDFDGLLVNTEPVHYQAYLNTFLSYGMELGWTYPQYCQFAHSQSSGVKKALQSLYMPLFQTVSWEQLYTKKKQEYIRLIQEKPVELMPGVQDLLEHLHGQNIKSCVVTNSTQSQIEPIKVCEPLLKAIPYWITREKYKAPKPDPECYRLAVEAYQGPNDRVIGFEDTPRGWMALQKNPIKPVLISKTMYPDLRAFIRSSQVTYFSSFEKINVL